METVAEKSKSKSLLELFDKDVLMELFNLKLEGIFSDCCDLFKLNCHTDLGMYG